MFAKIDHDLSKVWLLLVQTHITTYVAFDLYRSLSIFLQFGYIVNKIMFSHLLCHLTFATLL